MKKKSERVKKHVIHITVESEELYAYSYSDLTTFAQRHGTQQVGSSNSNSWFEFLRSPFRISDGKQIILRYAVVFI